MIMKKLPIRTPTVINDFDQNSSRVKVYRKYYSDLANANSITTSPLSGSLSQIHGDVFAHELLDRFADRFNRKFIGQMIVSKEFFRLSRKKEMPIHEYLYPYPNGAHTSPRRLFVKLFDVFLLFTGYRGKQRGTETHHLRSDNLAYACASKFLYFVFKCRGHLEIIANQASSSMSSSKWRSCDGNMELKRGVSSPCFGKTRLKMTVLQ